MDFTLYGFLEIFLEAVHLQFQIDLLNFVIIFSYFCTFFQFPNPYIQLLGVYCCHHIHLFIHPLLGQYKLVLPSLSVCMSVCFSFIHLLLGRQHQSGSRFLRHTSEFEILLSMTHSKYNRLGIGHAEVLVPLKQF